MSARPLLILALAASAAACTQAPLYPAAPASVERLQAPDGVPFAVWLQDERAQVAGQRAAAEQRFHEAELACWHRFAVNACLSEAKQQRRATLDALREKDLALNATERDRRTAERLRTLEQKSQGSSGG